MVVKSAVQWVEHLAALKVAWMADTSVESLVEH